MQQGMCGCQRDCGELLAVQILFEFIENAWISNREPDAPTRHVERLREVELDGYILRARNLENRGRTVVAVLASEWAASLTMRILCSFAKATASE